MPKELAPHFARVYEAIRKVATSELGVHAETAIAAASRMAGAFLLLSFNFPLEKIEPGEPVFSDKANEKGPKLMQLFTAALANLKVPQDFSLSNGQVGPNHQPLMSVVQTQDRLHQSLTRIAEESKLSNEEMAYTCAITAARFVRDAALVLEPAIGIGLATYGFVEGSKTAPIQALRPVVKKKSWFGL